MEKQEAGKSKNKILRFLPKAAQLAAVSFQNPNFSPGRDKRPDITTNKLTRKGFSGPIVSIEAQRMPKNHETTQEPISPIVSCMGRVNHKNRISSKKKHAPLRKELKPDETGKIRLQGPAIGPKKKFSGIKNIFGAGRKADNKASTDYGNKPAIPSRAPCLSQMRRLASGRDSTLANFDWATARIVPEDQEDRGFCSEGYSKGKDDVIIPSSAPILGAGDRNGGGLGLGLERRKEINLWKRRTMAQPEPLQLSMVGAQ